MALAKLSGTMVPRTSACLALKVCFGSAAAASGPWLASLGLLGPRLFLRLGAEALLLHGAPPFHADPWLPLFHGAGCQGRC